VIVQTCSVITADPSDFVFVGELLINQVCHVSYEVVSRWLLHAKLLQDEVDLQDVGVLFSKIYLRIVLV
jgi:hypothetical protein